jgi:tetratricopeptide (TPR) repeat protein
MMRRLTGYFLLLVAASFAAEPGFRDQVTDLFKHRQWAEAQSVLEKIVAAEPDNAEAYYYLAQAQINRNDHEHAVLSMEKATTLAPANSEYFRLLGDTYGISAQKAGIFSKFGWARKCKAAYDKAVELDPKNVTARMSVLEYCRQAPGIVGGGMDEAYAQAAEIRKLDPSRGQQAFVLLYSSEKKYPEAFHLLDETLKETPDDYNALYQFGRLAADSGLNLDRGLAALRHCLELKRPPNSPGRAPTQWRIGNILEKQGDKAGARAAYETALKADPKFPQAIEALRKLDEADDKKS